MSKLYRGNLLRRTRFAECIVSLNPLRNVLFGTVRTIRRCKCLTRTLSHRCIGRVVPMALAPHHMPFGPAGTAREPCAQNLVGVLDALRRAPRRGGREKGFG